MVAIKLTAFSGEQPRQIPRLMPDNAAQSAINVRLDDELWPMLTGAAEALFGAERAAELLAPSA